MSLNRRDECERILIVIEASWNGKNKRLLIGLDAQPPHSDGDDDVAIDRQTIEKLLYFENLSKVVRSPVSVGDKAE